MKKPRPEVLGGVTAKVTTQCGNMYIQMNWCDGALFEVFATLGKTGGCAMSQTEAVTRSITLGLRCGVPVGEYINQLGGIRCPSPTFYPKESALLSCPDAIAGVLAKYGSLTTDEVVEIFRRANAETGKGGTSEVQEAIEHMEELRRIRVEQGL